MVTISDEATPMLYDIFLANDDDSARFLLGKAGERPLVAIGVNPSTADQDRADPTVRKVERFAARLGFDGFLLINAYPIRATWPAALPNLCDKELRRRNKEAIRSYLRHKSKPPVWAAWGNAIDTRSYLRRCLREIIETLLPFEAEWFSLGGPTRAGNPRHPCRLAYDQTLRPFDIHVYLRTAKEEP